MCGVVAAVALGGTALEPTVITRMSATISHRGPDDAGTYFAGHIGLGVRRLAIIDLSPLGHQPMSAPDGQLTVAFNGEIYNYQELRRELEDRGHRFRSQTDTEVLLAAYREWGRECLARLNGMWAFLIHDRRRNVLFGSRDRFGVKPLFRYRGRDHLLFASEIKAIRASGLFPHQVNSPTVAAFLVEGRLDDGPETFYSGITHVPAGHAFEVGADGHVSEWRYWSLTNLGEADVPDPPRAFAELFEDSVRLRLRSDVPVAVHLSGGLDSTSILCAAARLREVAGAGDRLIAFSFNSPHFDESAYIADTIAQTGAVLVPLETTPRKLWDSLAEVLWYQDEPVHSMQALVGYALMKLTAAHGVTVILNGHGSDETIAGYGSYFRDYWHALLQQGHMREVFTEIRAFADLHGGSVAALWLRQLRYLAQMTLGQAPAYQQLRQWRRRAGRHRDPWFDPDLVGQVLDEETPVRSGLQAALQHSVTVDPLPIYLRAEDRNSMAHSVEARMPFLDYRLVSLLFSLAGSWKMRGPWNKFILREGMRGRIPESVRSRVDKMGFPMPSRQWFADSLYEPVRDLLASRAARERGIYNVAHILQDLDAHRRGELVVTERLFRVVEFEVWSALQDTPWMVPKP